MPTRDHPYVRQYGAFAGPALYAPMFVIAMVGCLIGILIMIPASMFNAHTTIARGVPGEAIPLVWEGRATGPLLVASSTPVAEGAVTCEIHRDHHTPTRPEVQPTEAAEFHLNGSTWYPLFRLASTDSGDSFTCTGAGLGDLRAVRDHTEEYQRVAVLLTFSLFVFAGMAAMGFLMRGSANRKQD